jgi:hypothetical protein
MKTPWRNALHAFLDESIEICVALAVALVGLRSLPGGVTLSEAADDGLPLMLFLTWQLTLMMGAVLIITGLIGRYVTPLNQLGNRARWKVIERAGCMLQATSWVVYIFVLIGAEAVPKAALLFGMALALAVGFGLRAWKLRRDNDSVLAQLHSVNQSTN